MSLDFVVLTFIIIVGISTPVLLAGLGELVVERSGVLNLGIEGMMLLGAIAGFATTVATGNAYLGVLGAAAAGALAGLTFGLFALTLNANQVATGLALTIFGTGLSSLIGLGYVGRIVAPMAPIFPPALARDPALKALFGFNPIVYFAVAMAVAAAWFLTRTRAGLILRAVGENDRSAHAIGYSVIGVRYMALAFGGAMAGIGGAYFSLVITPMWAERMTAGRGWIAVALVVFASWRVGRLTAGAYLFGLLIWLELFAKGGGLAALPLIPAIPSQFWAAMPYLMTIAALVVISARDGTRNHAPACLGKPFLPSI